MRLNTLCSSMAMTLMLSGCANQGTNPADPYEPFNRKVHAFNTAVDSAVLKPTAQLYKMVIPALVRKGVNNVFNNLDMVPSVANDLLQAEGKWAIKDTWRFVLNSTLGIGGLFDVAEKCGLPAHYNDVGLTLAKWGDKKSPYIVIPLLGPSTIRDGSGMLFQFALWSPYVYINNDPLAYGLAGLRYIDLRTQMLDSERLMDEALDKYTFTRDAYLQHRNYLMAGSEDNGELYIEDGKADEAAVSEEKSPANTQEAPSDYVDE
jgi:phospholipid-binding lipoprotein MlaA